MSQLEAAANPEPVYRDMNTDAFSQHLRRHIPACVSCSTGLDKNFEPY